MAEKLRCTLTLEGIDALSDALDETLATARLSRKERARLRLMAEEILLGWMNCGLTDAPCTLTDDKRYGRRTLILRAQGVTADDPDPDLSNGFAAELAGQGAAWSVTHAAASTSAAISLPVKQRSDLFRLCAAIALAIVVSLLARLLPAGVADALNNRIVSPLIALFTRLLSVLAAPLLFFSLLSALIGMEDLRDQGRITRALAGRVAAGLAVSCAVACLFAALFYGVQTAGVTVETAFAAVCGVLQNAVPSGLIAPFVAGNVLQIAFLAVAAGVCVRMLEGKVPVLETASQQVGELLQQAMRLLMRLLPAFVFFAVLSLLRDAETDALIGAGRLLLFIAAVCLALLLLSAVLIAATFRRRPFPIMRRMLAVFLLGFASGSSAASYAAMDDLLTNGYGLRPRYVRIVLPFGLSMIRLARAASFIALCAFGANACDVPITPAFLLSAALSSVVLSLATPSVFGGTLASCVLLFAQAGLPLELLAVVAALDVLLERMTTSCDLVAMLSLLLCAARATGNAGAEGKAAA